MNDTFSSLVFAAKFDLSKKFKVEIGREEKKEWEGRLVGVKRFWGCRVINERSIAITLLKTVLRNKLGQTL
jgi:hypothetical protein